MKNFLKGIAALTFIGMFVYTKVSSADSQGGVLGATAGATDLYIVSCFDDGRGAPTRLGVEVQTDPQKLGISQAIKVSARSQKDKKATNTTDLVNGDSVSSTMTYNYGGSGDYYVTVGKTASSTVNVPYALTFHCQTSANLHTGTDAFLVQNQ